MSPQRRPSASRSRIARRITVHKGRAVGPTTSQAANAMRYMREHTVELEIGTLGVAYETIVKRQGLSIHKRGSQIELAWFHELHKSWRRACRSTD